MKNKKNTSFAITLTLLIFSGFVCHAQTSKKQQASFTNKSNASISFYYFDEYQDFLNINLKAKETKHLDITKPLLIYSTSFINEPFIITPNSEFSVSIDKNGKYLLAGTSVQKTSEAMLLKEIGNSINPVTNPKDALDAVNKDAQMLADPQKRDNQLNEKYKRELSLLQDYTKIHPVTDETIETAQNYFYYKLLSEKARHLTLKSFKEQKLSHSYRDSLIALRNFLNCDACVSLDSYKSFALNYLYYLESDRPKENILQYITTTFSGATKEFMLFSLMKGYSNRNKSLLNYNYEAFTKLVGNSAYKKYIANLYGFAQLKNDNNKKDLADAKNNRLSLDDLIKKYPKKVIYIDFWASWCVPCIAEMPNSFTLSKKMTGKDIVFVYFSLDKNKNAWLASAKENNINTENSYLLINDYGSSIAKQFKIKEIPRYIIIGKDGKVINDDAPRPSDGKLISLISQLMDR